MGTRHCSTPKKNCPALPLRSDCVTVVVALYLCASLSAGWKLGPSGLRKISPGSGTDPTLSPQQKKESLSGFAKRLHNLCIIGSELPLWLLLPPLLCTLRIRNASNQNSCLSLQKVSRLKFLPEHCSLKKLISSSLLCVFSK